MFLPPPSSDQISYLINLHMSALWVATLPDQDVPTLIGNAADLARSIKNTGLRHKGMREAQLRGAWWGERPAVAMLLNRVERELGHSYVGRGICTVPVLIVSGIVELCARRLDLRIAGHDQVMRTVGTAVTVISDRVEASRQTGGLSFVSKEYARRRKAAQETGRPFPSWTAIQRRVSRVMAEHVSVSGLAPEMILRRVFGE